MKLFSKIRAIFRKKHDGIVEVIDREEFAHEIKEDFRGNAELLKAIEKCMNRNVKPYQRVALTN